MAKPKDKERARKDSGISSEVGVGGILKGLAGLVERLGDLAEKGGELSRTGQIGDEKGIKGVYGFSVKVGAAGEGVKVEPFGNIAKDKSTGRSVVEEIREPMVDVFDEADHTLVIAEMPGIGPDDVQLESNGAVLTIRAEKGDRKYRKEIVLPQSFARERMKITCSNGVLKIKCMK